MVKKYTVMGEKLTEKEIDDRFYSAIALAIVVFGIGFIMEAIIFFRY